MENNKVTTEVTSIAKEEEKTGQQIQVPNEQELVSRASSSYISGLKSLEQLINQREGSGFKLGRKAINRVLLAIISLPTEGIPVKLDSKEEKEAFFIGQKLIADRFILTQHHINEQIREIKASREAKKEENKQQDTPKGGTND